MLFMSNRPTGAERYLARRLADPEYRDAYEAARARIDAIDGLLQAIDERRVALNLSKAELARRAGLKDSAVRRLFSASRPNPTLGTVVALAEVLELEIRPAPRARPAATAVRSAGSRTPQPVA
jgi:DNA-binding phage protein